MGWWRKLHDKILDSDVFLEKDPLFLKLWVLLILRAVHSKTVIEGITLQPGQLICTTRGLASLLQTNRSKVRRMLNQLTEWCQISIEVTHQFTIITVCNFSSYNNTDTTERPTPAQYSTHNATHKKQDANCSDEKTCGNKKNQSDPQSDPQSDQERIYNRCIKKEEKKCSSPHFDESSPEQRLAAKWCQVKLGPDATKKQIQTELAFATPKIKKVMDDGLSEKAIAAVMDGSHDSIFDVFKAARSWRPPEDWERSSNTPENPAYKPGPPASPEVLSKFREMRRKIPRRATA